MSMTLGDALAALRRPEYTGTNRCTPCTLVNAAIAIVAAVVVAIVVPLDATASVAAGGAVLVVAGAAIWLRGYLVPGTPWLTRTYLPDWVLRHFDHGEPAPMAESDVEPAAVLDAAGAVTECEDIDDLCLADVFRTAWYDRIEELRGTDATRTTLAAMLDLPPDDLDVEEHGGALVAMATDPNVGRRRRVGQWESSGAFLADMAGARVLEDRFPRWSDLPTADRGRVLSGLRVFLDACPSCGGPVEFGEETVESCCRSREVVAVTCAACGDRLLEADQPAAA
jgi:hypothetical protein